MRQLSRPAAFAVAGRTSSAQFREPGDLGRGAIA